MKVTETITHTVCDIKECGKEATSKCPSCELDICSDHSTLWTSEFPKIWINLCVYCKSRFQEEVASLVRKFGGDTP